jgi:hypothetical protein
MAFLLAAALGVLLTTVLIATVILASTLRPPSPGVEDVASPTPWGAIAAAFVLFIPLHELLHLVCHPGWGLTDRSTVVVWPRRLQIGVHYEGILSRVRWVAMRMAPFILLTCLPALVVIAWPRPSPPIETALTLTAVLNALGSGGDVLAVLLVMPQVSPSGRLRFQAGRVRWSPS